MAFTGPVHVSENAPQQKGLLPMEFVSEWAEMTPWHCVNNVHGAKRTWSKLAWLIIVLFTAFIAFYQSTMLFFDYYDGGDWVTTINYEEPEGGVMDWPNMTVCNHALRFKSGLRSRNLTDPYEIAYEITQLDGTTTAEEGVQFYKRYQETEYLNVTDEELLADVERRVHDKLENTAGMSVSDILDKYGERCNATVLHCGLWNQFTLHDGAQCCNSDSKQSSRSCFTLNPTVIFDRKKYSTEQQKEGVYFLLDPSTNDYYENIVAKSIPSAGLKTELYFGIPEGSVSETLFMSPGTNVLVVLTAEKRLTAYEERPSVPFYTPNKPCVDSYNYRHIDWPTYTKQLCRNDCRIERQFRLCNCTIYTAKLKKNLQCIGEHKITECSKWDKNDSSFNVTYNDKFNVYECMESCKDSCEYLTLQTQATYSKFPAPAKLSAFTLYLNRALSKKTGITYTEEDASQLILVEMKFQAMSFKVITKAAKSTVGQFISNIGGALGVWTGLSLLSIFQALVYACLFLEQFWKRVYEKYFRSDTMVIPLH